jgi:hypothetical protein
VHAGRDGLGPARNHSNKFRLFFSFYFRVEQAGSAGAAHIASRPADSTVLLQIQPGSLGNPPTPSASDLTLALDRY